MVTTVGKYPLHTYKVLLNFHGNSNEIISGQPASSKNDEHGYCQSNGDLGEFQKIYHLPTSGPGRFFYKPACQRGWGEFNTTGGAEVTDPTEKEWRWDLNSGPWRSSPCPSVHTTKQVVRKLMSLGAQQETGLKSLCRSLERSNRPTRTKAAKGSHYMPQT